MRMLVTILLALVPVAAGAISPIEEAWCEPRAQLERKLERQFGAGRRAVGVRDPEQVMELWTDAEGDWTLVVSYAAGMSCIVAMGEHWQELAPSKEPA